MFDNHLPFSQGLETGSEGYITHHKCLQAGECELYIYVGVYVYKYTRQHL